MTFSSTTRKMLFRRRKDAKAQRRREKREGKSVYTGVGTGNGVIKRKDAETQRKREKLELDLLLSFV